MKKKINDVVKVQSKKAAVKMAEYYANVSCPLVAIMVLVHKPL